MTTASFKPAVRTTGMRRYAAYRRLGYRVVVEGQPAVAFRWKVFRPWLRTVSASGYGETLEAVVDAANQWIREDVISTRARRSTR